MALSMSERVLNALERGPTTAKARTVYAWIKEHPGASLSAVQKAVGCSRSAAQVWTQVVQIENGLRERPNGVEEPSKPDKAAKAPEPQEASEAPPTGAVDIHARLSATPPAATPSAPEAEGVATEEPPHDATGDAATPRRGWLGL